MFKKILCLLMFLPALCMANTPRGEELVQRLWKDMKANNVGKIKEYTSKEFQGFNQLPSGKVFQVSFGFSANGSLNRFQELDFIKQIHISDYYLTNIKVTQGDNMIVVAYYAYVNKTIYAKPIQTQDAYLSVWKRLDGQWKWVAHADLGGTANNVINNF